MPPPALRVGVPEPGGDPRAGAAADDAPAQALRRLAALLADAGYRFITVTPETHRRVLQRRADEAASSLRDVFGWNLPFAPGFLPREMHECLQTAGVLAQNGSLLRSRVRFATIDGLVYLHSGYPTTEPDSVFFGPDTYRFATLIQAEVAGFAAPVERVLDLGCGGGAGGLVAVRALRRAGLAAEGLELTLVDINDRALDYARVNAATAEQPRTLFRHADLYEGMTQPAGLIVANPPYLLDPGERLYRHGGGSFGSALSERIVAEGLRWIAPGGALVLYTGVPIVDGADPFLETVERVLQGSGMRFEHRELDPDVFGEELEQPAYARAERIAAVALVVRHAADDASMQPS